MPGQAAAAQAQGAGQGAQGDAVEVDSKEQQDQQELRLETEEMWRAVNRHVSRYEDKEERGLITEEAFFKSKSM